MYRILTVCLALTVISCGAADGDEQDEGPECTLREHGIELPLETEDMYGVWKLKYQPVDEQPGGFYYESWSEEGVGPSKVPFRVEKSTIFYGDSLVYANPRINDESTIGFNNNETHIFTAYDCPPELIDVYIPYP
jgi:hypothetical protein